jgi:predicted ATPase
MISLFDAEAALVPFGSWLREADVARLDEVTKMMGNLLPPGVRFRGEFMGEQPVFSVQGIELPLPALSDGMQTYIGWVGDLLFQLDAVATPARLNLSDVGGVVMVDEIDLLLHPSWQRTVVRVVANMFPKIQFIFTTHSPIVTGTLEAENITLAEGAGRPGTSTLRTVDAQVHGLNAEQVLLSSYFDLQSTRSPDVTPTLEDLARRAVDGDDQARDRYLDALSKGLASEELDS